MGGIEKNALSPRRSVQQVPKTQLGELASGRGRSLFLFGTGEFNLAADQAGDPIGECAPVAFGQFLGRLFQVGIDAHVEDFRLGHVTVCNDLVLQM